MAGTDQDAINQFTGPNAKYKISIDPTNGKTSVVGAGSGSDVKAKFLYVDSNGDWIVYTTMQDAIDKYAADIKAAGATEVLRQRMYEMGKISKKEYESKSAAAYNSGLGDYINDFTVAQVSALVNGTAKSFVPLLSWARSSSGGNVPSVSTSSTVSTDTSKTTSTDVSTSTDINTYVNLSSAAAANNELNLFFQQQLGREATDLEKAAYLIYLNNAEKAVSTTSTTTSDTTSTSQRTGTTTSETTSKTTSGTASSKTSSTGKSATDSATTGKSTSESTRTTIGGSLSADDKTKIMSSVLANSIKDLSAADLMKTGGSVAQGISDLLSFAGDYALPNYTADLAKNDILGKLKSGMPVGTDLIDSEKMAIKSLAKSFYPNLSNLIDQGVKVSNIGTIYAQQLGKVLEVPYTGVDLINNKYIQAALQNKNADGVVGKEGTLGLDDFTKMLRKDPAWAKTQNAREEASSYAMNILKSFGLVG
jgi:hypothetical protein